MFRKKFRQEIKQEPKSTIEEFNMLNFTFIIESEDYDFYSENITEEYVEQFMDVITIIEGDEGLILDATESDALCDFGFEYFIIPDFIDDEPVVELGNNFLNDNIIGVLIIAENVSKIGKKAFNYSTIYKIEVKNEDCIIDPTAFNHLSELNEIVNENDQFILNNILFGISKQKNTIVIDNGVTEIASNVFKDMDYLTKVIAPNTLTKINSYAFSSCSNLKTFECENSSNIVFADSSFYACDSLSQETKELFMPKEKKSSPTPGSLNSTMQANNEDSVKTLSEQNKKIFNNFAANNSVDSLGLRDLCESLELNIESHLISFDEKNEETILKTFFTTLSILHEIKAKVRKLSLEQRLKCYEGIVKLDHYFLNSVKNYNTVGYIKSLLSDTMFNSVTALKMDIGKSRLGISDILMSLHL